MLTVKQAAARVGVSSSLVYAWCREQRLPHYRIGRENKRGQIRITPDDLDALVKSLRQAGHPLLAGTR